MSIAPSKKKLDPSISSKAHIDILSNLACTSPANNYPMLQQIYRKSISNAIFQTPSKSSKTKKTQIFWTESTQPATSYKKIDQLAKRLQGMRNKIQMRRRRITMLVNQIEKVNSYRLKISKYKIQILQSANSLQSIGKLYEKGQSLMGEIKREIRKIKQQVQDTQKQTIKIGQNIMNLEGKVKQMNQNYQKMMQIRSNINYAVQSQVKKNNNLKSKFQAIRHKLLGATLLQKLAKQLFAVFILMIQIKNVDTSSRTRKRQKQFQQNRQKHNVVDLCFNNSQYLKSIPSELAIICQIYFALRLKEIDRKYLNKISFFCAEAKSLFNFNSFYSTITAYFTTYFEECQNLSLEYCDKQFPSQIQHDITKQKHMTLRNQSLNYEVQFIAIAYLSSKCGCGKLLQSFVSNKRMQRMIESKLKLKIIQIGYRENCNVLIFTQAQAGTSEFMKLQKNDDFQGKDEGENESETI